MSSSDSKDFTLVRIQAHSAQLTGQANKAWFEYDVNLFRISDQAESIRIELTPHNLFLFSKLFCSVRN